MCSQTSTGTHSLSTHLGTPEFSHTHRCTCVPVWCTLMETYLYIRTLTSIHTSSFSLFHCNLHKAYKSRMYSSMHFHACGHMSIHSYPQAHHPLSCTHTHTHQPLYTQEGRWPRPSESGERDPFYSVGTKLYIHGVSRLRPQ